MPTTTPFQDWALSLLHARGLEAPDGRLLYAYRLDNAEFRELETLLKGKLALYRQAWHLRGNSNLTPLGVIAERVSGFPALFVLYAAEWWRQRYDGSGFSWEPILCDLGADINGWNQAQRSGCVTRGLKDWRLSLHETAGLRYIGAIALQGGLPMRLLAAARGALGRLLRSVLKEATKAPVTSIDIQNWVRSLDHYLPLTYRQPQIHVLLAEVIVTVLRLKEEAGLTESAGAVSELERRIPGWRDSFPLPVEDIDAQGLIEQLIRDAADVRVGRQTRLFVVERHLERNHDGSWQLRSLLPLTDAVDVAPLAKIFSTEGAELPRFLGLTLAAADGRHTTSLRRLAGQDKYRIDRRPWEFFAVQAVAEHVLHLSAPDGRVWSATAPRGEALDEDLPWVFDARDESRKWLRQGSGAVATNEALVALPARWSPVDGAQSSITPEDRLEAFERQVFRVRGDARFARDDRICRIRTGRADAREETYEWYGQRLWQAIVRPPMGFLGKPRLYQVDENNHSQAVAGEPGWCPLGGNRATLNTPLGPVQMWYPATGEVRHRAHMLILPPAARMVLEFGDATSGRIRLQRWGAISLRVNHPGVAAEVALENEDLIVSLRVSSQVRVPEWIEADVYWAHTAQPARLHLPFPALGARVFAADGRDLQPGSLLAANQLLGVRVICLGGNPSAMPRMSLEFRLDGREKKLAFPITPPANSIQAEIRLQDFASEIAQLLANDDSPDAQIKAVVRIGNESSAQLHIARYACCLERSDDSSVFLEEGSLHHLSPEALLVLPVLALRLETPGEEPERLQPLTSEGVPTGAWAFVQESREPGSWLIYPATDSLIAFRPTLWTIAGDRRAVGSLTQAIGIVETAQREVALGEAIRVLVADFLAPEWTDVERLAAQLGHLPLVTLDLWRRFARSGEAMAALALRFASLPPSFIERFSSELPFAWETVPFAAWRDAICNLRRQCETSYGEGVGTVVFRSHLEGRIGELTSLHPALYNLLGFAHAAVTGEIPKEIRLFRELGSDSIANRLFVGSDSPLQRLLRNLADGVDHQVQWPTFFNARIAIARNDRNHGNLLCPERFDSRDGVINLPVLLAIQSATGGTQEWFADSGLVHELRRHLTFDPDWFVDAFNWSIARCLAAGLLDSDFAR